jgi:ribosomal protein L11 methylase PrmA
MLLLFIISYLVHTTSYQHYHLHRHHRSYRHYGSTVSHYSSQLSTSDVITTINNIKIIAKEADDDITGSDEEAIWLVDVGSGWGNGAHPTTRLCLEYLTNTIKKGDVVLDYGCGSGILAITSIKLGASTAIAVDIDEDSIKAAEKNVDINGYSDVIKVTHTKYIYLGSGEGTSSISDVTCANILPGALSRLAPTLWGLTKPGGSLMLSGSIHCHHYQYQYQIVSSSSSSSLSSSSSSRYATPRTTSNSSYLSSLR